MTRFSDKEIDRQWSQEELSELSEKELTVLAFHRNLKNLIFFGLQAIIVYLVIGYIGSWAVYLGWISIGLLVLFSLEPAIAIITTLVLIIPSTIRSSSNLRWKLLQLLIAVITFTIFIIFALLIYFKIY